MERPHVSIDITDFAEDDGSDTGRWASIQLVAEGHTLVELLQSAYCWKIDQDGGECGEATPWDLGLDTRAEAVIRAAYEAENGPITEMEFQNAVRVAFDLDPPTHHTLRDRLSVK